MPRKAASPFAYPSTSQLFALAHRGRAKMLLRWILGLGWPKRRPFAPSVTLLLIASGNDFLL